MNAENLLIREFNENDAPLVEEFFANMGAESTAMFNSSGGNLRCALSAVKGELPNSIFWMAEDTSCGKMAGYVFLWNIDKSVPWFGIAVADDWKGKHLGSRLISVACDYCKRNGYGGILLSTMFENYHAQRLYEKYGFERIGKLGDGNVEYLYIRRFDK